MASSFDLSIQGMDHVNEGIGKEKKNTCFEMGKGEGTFFCVCV